MAQSSSFHPLFYILWGGAPGNFFWCRVSGFGNSVSLGIMRKMRLRVCGLWLGVWGVGFGDQGLGLRVYKNGEANSEAS